MATPAGFENKVGFIWKIADKLRGDFKQHEYGAIMLPTYDPGTDSIHATTGVGREVTLSLTRS